MFKHFHQCLFDIYFNVPFSPFKRQKEAIFHQCFPQTYSLCPCPHPIHKVLFKNNWDSETLLQWSNPIKKEEKKSHQNYVKMSGFLTMLIWETKLLYYLEPWIESKIWFLWMSLASISEDPPSLEQYGYRKILPYVLSDKNEITKGLVIGLQS